MITRYAYVLTDITLNFRFKLENANLHQEDKVRPQNQLLDHQSQNQLLYKSL